MATTYSAMAKLYGLKLYQGTITESRIPAKYRSQAIEYSQYLTSINN